MYGFFSLSSVYDCTLGFLSIWELELFLIDIGSVVAVYMVVQKLGIVL